jgi:hypothetical protein
MLRRILIMSMVLVFSTGVTAWATCDQQELEGTWDLRIGATGEFDEPCWERASLTIGPNGVVQGGTYTNCISGESADITGGSLTFSSGTCVIEGFLTTPSETVNLHSGAIVGDKGHLSFGRTAN